MKKIFPLFFVLSSQSYSISYTWNEPGSGAWDSTTHWSPSGAYPNAVGDRAIFGNSITSPASVIFSSGSPSPITVGRIDFDSSSFMYTVESLINPQTLTFQSSSGNSQLNVNTGAQDVFCDFIGEALLTFNLVSSLDCHIAAGKTLIFNSPDVTGSAGWNMNGPGTLRIEGTGGEFIPDLNIKGGILELNLHPGSFVSGNYNLSGGELKNLNNDQLNSSSPGPSLTLDGGTWNMNGFTDGVNILTFNSGNLTGNSQDLVIKGGLLMRNVTLNGSLTFITTSSIIFDATNGGTATISGTIFGGSQSITFNIDSGSAAFDMLISGSLQGSGAISKVGAGTLLFNGINTHTGLMTISDGALLIGSGGSFADQTIHVSPGSSFGGVGVVGAGHAIVNNSGTLTPGLSPGVFTINGSYNQTSSGHFKEELFSPTHSDKLVVNGGGVSLAGALDLVLLPDHSHFGNQVVTMIDNTAGAGVTGTFDTVTRSGFPSSATFLELIYQSNEVLLHSFIPEIKAIPHGSISAPVFSQITQNTLNFSRHLEQIRPVAIKKPSQHAITSDHLQIANKESLIAASNFYSMFAPKNSNKRQDMVSEPADRRDSAFTNTWGVFGDVIGSLGRVYTSSSNYPFDYYNAGGLIGFDYVGESFAIGFSPGYEYLHAHAIHHENKFNIQSALGTFFATVLPFKDQNLFVDFIGGGAYQWYHFQRNTTDGVVNGKTNGGEWNLYSDIGYTFNARKFMFSSCNAIPYITPWLGLGYMEVRVASCKETGSENQVFKMGHQKIQSLRTTLGATFNYVAKWCSFSFLPEARVLWQREFLNHNKNVSYAHLPEISSQIQVIGLGRDTVVIGTLLRLLFNEKNDLYGSYDYEWNDSFHSHLFMIGSECRF